MVIRQCLAAGVIGIGSGLVIAGCTSAGGGSLPGGAWTIEAVDAAGNAVNPGHSGRIDGLSDRNFALGVACMDPRATHVRATSLDDPGDVRLISCAGRVQRSQP